MLRKTLGQEKEKTGAQLVLAGGNGWQNEEIYQAARESRYGNDIIFTGYLTNEEKNCLYRHAALFVFPSLYEGFGMPPLEAMHWGCPVVTANTAPLPEACGDAAELVDPFKIESIANGIRRVYSDRQYADSLREKGCLQEKKFTWEASAQRLRDVCKEVLGE